MADIAVAKQQHTGVDVRPGHQRSVQRREVRCGTFEQLRKAVDDEVVGLIGIDLVARPHGAHQVEWQTIGRLSACMLEFANELRMPPPYGGNPSGCLISPHSTVYRRSRANMSHAPASAPSVRLCPIAERSRQRPSWTALVQSTNARAVTPGGRSDAPYTAGVATEEEFPPI